MYRCVDSATSGHCSSGRAAVCCACSWPLRGACTLRRLTLTLASAGAQLLHGAVFSKLNLVVNAGDSGEWNGADFEQDSDGGYPFAGEHYGVAGTPVPSRSIEGWYPVTGSRLHS